MLYKHQLISQQPCLRRAPPARRPRLAGRTGGPWRGKAWPAILRSCLQPAAPSLGWPLPGLTMVPRNTVRMIDMLGKPRPRQPPGGLTLSEASPACVGVPGASSGFSTLSREAPSGAWQQAWACLCQETRPLWDTVTDEGRPNSLRRAAPWAPTDDYHGVGGHVLSVTSDLETHPLARAPANPRVRNGAPPQRQHC